MKETGSPTHHEPQSNSLMAQDTAHSSKALMRREICYRLTVADQWMDGWMLDSFDEAGDAERQRTKPSRAGRGDRKALGFDRALPRRWRMHIYIGIGSIQSSSVGIGKDATRPGS